MSNDLLIYIREQMRKHPNMRAHALENKISAWEVARQLQEDRVKQVKDAKEFQDATRAQISKKPDSFKRLCDDMAANLKRKEPRGWLQRFAEMFS